MNEFIVVYVTVGSPDEGDRLARALVEERLAACVNRVRQVQSTYRWQGKVNTTPEFTMSVKTTPQRWQTLQDILVREHPYELPEIVGQEIQHVSDAYYDWVCGEVQ